jgi:hypothetical protein
MIMNGPAMYGCNVMYQWGQTEPDAPASRRVDVSTNVSAIASSERIGTTVDDDDDFGLPVSRRVSLGTAMMSIIVEQD